MIRLYFRGDAVRLACAVAGFALLTLAEAAPAVAQEFFAARREFRLTKACDATRTIRTAADPKPQAAGAVVEARGLNRRNSPTHVFVLVERENRWIELSCGEFADGEAANDLGDTDARPARCLAFFDDVANPEDTKTGRADVSPVKPELNAFDKAINATCGSPGKSVSLDEFKAMMLAHPAVLERVKAFTGGKVFADRPARRSNGDYLADLTEAWFAVKAFDHIFCGEPNPRASEGKIGGLHFAGRYLQLQEAGQACRMANFRQNEVVPDVIYTMGVVMQNASGQMVRDARKGYGLTMSGEDILKAATKAFLENPTPNSESTACLASVTDDGKQFTTVFVRRKAGIRTFYPDATPDTRRNAACAAPVRL